MPKFYIVWSPTDFYNESDVIEADSLEQAQEIAENRKKEAQKYVGHARAEIYISEEHGDFWPIFDDGKTFEEIDPYLKGTMER